MSTTLAASCLTCRKRQVRCDGARPTCTRCPKDGRECRGYKGQLRIVHVDPAKKPPQTVCKRPKAAPQPVTTAELVLPRHIFADDRDAWTIVQCAEYWNAHVIPELFPTERPFYRVFIKANDIINQPLPKVCLHFVIVAFRSAQAARLEIDPATQPDLFYYRGLGLRELVGHLDDAATDPQGIALISIVMLLGSELYLDETSWLLHLNAARRIVAMRGGMAACMRMGSDTVFILVQFLIVDTLTSTTCRSDLLPQLTYEELIGDIPVIDFELITCISACPAEILKTTARISVLRLRRLDCNRTKTKDEFDDCGVEYNSLLASLEDFSCTAWAAKMSQLGLSYPITTAEVAPCRSIDGLVSAAECFRSAALLYLLLSCGDLDDESTTRRAQEATATLHTELTSLFAKASDKPNDPLDAQLWKFVTWPLVMRAYVWVSWDLGPQTTDLNLLYTYLHRIAKCKGTLLRWTAESHLQEVQARRAAHPRRRWTWDMGFAERRPFVI